MKLDIDLPDDLSEALDRYAAHAAGSPARADVVALIVHDWLAANGYLQSDPMAALDREVGEFPVELDRGGNADPAEES